MSTLSVLCGDLPRIIPYCRDLLSQPGFISDNTAIWLDFSHWSAGQQKGIDLLGPKAAPIAAFLYSSFCRLKLSKATGPA